MEVSFPRFILPQFNTHRSFSRNFSSSRAIPIKTMIERLREDPFVPMFWGKNQKGMSAEQEISDNKRELASVLWLQQRDRAIQCVSGLMDFCDVHKQTANRILEPWMWVTGIISATEWDNFFALRCGDAQPEFRHLAELIRDVRDHSTPEALQPGEWHVPMLDDGEQQLYRRAVDAGAVVVPESLRKIAVGRCARVSYLTHDGKRDASKDLELTDRLLAGGHLSPFEHVARCDTGSLWDSNFKEWYQYRSDVQKNLW